jgi:asparaginyl-tRNA synthetase
VELSVVDPEAHGFKVVGKCDQGEYPLSKKAHSLEYLREIAHLRPRTNTIGAVARIRNALAFATHEYFNQRGFLYIHTPIVTASDCEGAGEMFQVSTILKDKRADIPETNGNVDYKQDFFGRPAFLTVSGQLAVENFCCALSDVYTFGPTFRAENSHTSRHLAEFWMIEPELAFADLEDNIACAEGYLRHCLAHVLERNADDLEFCEATFEPGLIARLRAVADNPFARMTYTEAHEILVKSG